MDGKIASALDAVLTRLDQVVGAGYSVVLYGSRARGEEHAGSDYNLLVVADHLEPDRLKGLAATLVAVRVAGGAPPLLIELEEWRRAADVFPIELTDMGLARQVLRGEDPVAGVHVEPADLRRALEAELRAKLIRLRQAFAVSADDPKALGAFGARASSTLLALLRATLVLVGRPAGGAPAAVLAEAAAVLGVPTDAIARLHAQRGDREPRATAEEFIQVLTAVSAAVGVIDRFLPGGN
jgi:predicted nucleotidyltransferase